jgi:quercetin dioxygenase-like cupin family protein
MRHLLIPSAALMLASAVPALGQPVVSPAPQTSASSPPILVSQLLPDVPGKRLVVVRLKLPAARDAQPQPHRHPGSVFVYVTEGIARLGVQGQPVQTVHAGQVFYEPQGALHTVAASDSDTETASAIAIMIVPDGAPLVLPPDDHARP